MRSASGLLGRFERITQRNRVEETYDIRLGVLTGSEENTLSTHLAYCLLDGPSV
jgi:hypothetical protein